MKLQGEHRFPVGRDALWAALLDPTLLVRVLPGCEPLVPAGENAWRAAMALRVGPVQGRFEGTLALSDLVEATSYRMAIDGSGPAGFLRGSGVIALADDGDGTRLAYEVDAEVGGRVASVGQRLVESSARALAKQGLEGLERELAQRAAAGEGAAAPAPPAPSQAAFAARFARGLFGELPLAWRLAIVALALAALLLLVFSLAGCGAPGGQPRAGGSAEESSEAVSQAERTRRMEEHAAEMQRSYEEALADEDASEEERIRAYQEFEAERQRLNREAEGRNATGEGGQEDP